MGTLGVILKTHYACGSYQKFLQGARTLDELYESMCKKEQKWMI